MKSYKARIIREGYYNDNKINLRVGDNVDVVYKYSDRTSLIRLPRRLHGKGHTGGIQLGNRFRACNYYWVSNSRLEKIE